MADRDSMYSWEGTTASSLPWPSLGMDQYNEACRRCEKHVLIATHDVHDKVLKQLRYDKRPYGSRGRALQAAIPELGLQAGDRLEPCVACPDIGQFESVSLPATVAFWRPSLDTVTRHRNPLFNVETGILITSLRVDPLHCLYLGVFQIHCSCALWAMIDADRWNTAATGHLTALERIQASCLALQADLHLWFQQRRRADPLETLTEVQDVSPVVIGNKGDQRLGLKGGETKTLMLFLQACLEKWSGAIQNGPHMLAAGSALIAHIAVMKDSARVFTPAQSQDSRVET